MVHLAPLPGSPASRRSLADIVRHAVADACALAEAGFDAVLVENFGDAPFRAGPVDPHTVAAMTVVVRAVRRAVARPVGVNVLRNDARTALAVAAACGAAFIRVNVHTGVYATDQGILEGRADETLRYRRRIGTSAVIFADVHVNKHAVPLFASDLAQAARETAYRGGADGLIVSGPATGEPTDLGDLRKVREAVPDRPVLAGSGVTIEQVRAILQIGCGAIVGTAIKRDGCTTAPVDPDRAKAFIERART